MSSMTFKSKVDGWLLCVMVGGMACALIGTIAAGSLLSWPIIAFTVLAGCALPLWFLCSTSYTIEDQHLLVKAGPFRWRVPIASITSVTPTRNPLSSPALSLDRLLIAYDEKKSLMISPENREEFLRQLENRRAMATKPAPRMA